MGVFALSKICNLSKRARFLCPLEGLGSIKRRNESQMNSASHSTVHAVNAVHTIYSQTRLFADAHALHGQQVLTINAGLKLVDIQPGPARETRDEHCRRFGYQKLPAVSLAFDPMTTYT